MLLLLEAPGDKDPLSRSSFDPGHFTASAFVLSPHGDILLLIKHRKLGIWLQPGGHVDPEDSDLRAAARREVAEETGLTELQDLSEKTPVLDVDVHLIPERPGGTEPSHRHFDVRFLFRSRTESLQAGDDAADARWVPLGQVPGFGTDESVLRALSKLC